MDPHFFPFIYGPHTSCSGHKQSGKKLGQSSKRYVQQIFVLCLLKIEIARVNRLAEENSALTEFFPDYVFMVIPLLFKSDF